MSEEPEETPTNVLIKAMENADDMAEVMVIFRLKSDANGHGGMGWATMHDTLPKKLAFIEEAKIAMFTNVYVEHDI